MATTAIAAQTSSKYDECEWPHYRPGNLCGINEREPRRCQMYRTIFHLLDLEVPELNST